MRLAAGLFFFLLINVSCSVNVLESFADSTTNEALLVDAKKLMNVGDYAGAIAKMDKMTADYQAERTIVALRAQAYAGVCGLNFFDLVDAIGNLGSQKVLAFLLSNFRSGTTTAKIDACVTAETLIKSIGAVGARTTDENLLMLLVSFAKVGTVLSYYADVDQDGTATSAYNVCTIGASRTAAAAMPDADVGEVGTGLTLALEALTAVSSSVNLGSGSLNNFSSVCSQLPASYNFCAKTDKSGFNTNELKGIRSLIREGHDVGLNLNGCGGNNVSTVGCFCP